MCPACLTTAAVAIAATSSAGGMAAFIAKLRRSRIPAPVREASTQRPSDR